MLIEGVMRLEPETRTADQQAGNQLGPSQRTAFIPHFELREVAADSKDVGGFLPDGKSVDAARLRERPSRETTVIISADGKPVHPFYLRNAAKETLVLVLSKP